MSTTINKNGLTVYGGEGCPACKMATMRLDDAGIPYTYIDITEDDYAQNRLANKVGNWSIPKFEYGDKILDYSVKTMETVIEDLA